MNRRMFLAALSAASAGAQAPSRGKLLLPSDQPDEHNLRIMWYSPVEPIDQSTYKLRVSGLVEKPLALTVADLRKLPQETQSSRMKCVQCWSSRISWGGFRFASLMDLVKPKAGAKAVRFDCHDKWYEYMSLQEMASPRLLMAMAMAGRPLADRHGAPLRMIDPSKYGYKSAKLITQITFVAEGKGSMACDIGPYYSPTGEILAGYDTPLDLGGKTKHKIKGGEITEY
jgi:sulfoxide reductase catalytic subunit YedY